MNIEWKGVMPAVTTKFLDNQDLDLNNFTIKKFEEAYEFSKKHLESGKALTHLKKIQTF